MRHPLTTKASMSSARASRNRHATGGRERSDRLPIRGSRRRRVPHGAGRPGVLAPLLTALIAGCVSSSTFAARTIEQPEGSFEAALAEVVLPRSTAGSVAFPPCGGCSRIALPVGLDTVYLIERSPVALAEWLSAAEDAKAAGRAERTAVYVFYDIETRRVNRLVLDGLDD